MALLVYVMTATALELYWMHPSVQQFVALSMPPPTTALMKMMPPPPPLAALPLSAQSPLIEHRSAFRHAGTPKGRSESANETSRPTTVPDTLSATSAAATAATAPLHTRSQGLRDAKACWRTPEPFFEPPFDEGFASVVWARPTSPFNGPLEDIPAQERSLDWPKEKIARLERMLPSRQSLESRRYGTCAVVGSSPELLLYKDGAAIDNHDAVFRANLAVTKGWETHVGKRTTVRVINPVESIRKARGKGDDGMAIIKNQDPPAIRSPSKVRTPHAMSCTKKRD